MIFIFGSTVYEGTTADGDVMTPRLCYFLSNMCLSMHGENRFRASSGLARVLR